MTAVEKKICEDILAEGIVKSTESGVTVEGIEYESYTVEYFGETYIMTKNNGEWVYFHHQF